MNSSIGQTIHLDLGCGLKPRNPYAATRVIGLDSRAESAALIDTPQFKIVNADAGMQPLPFESDYFSSISAFDFMEHIPRQIFSESQARMTYPFISLMNEIYRTLRPGGLFLAYTPVYPSAEAFQDPTHVNYITQRTHEYFCGPEPMGRMYGFDGHFEVSFVGKTDYKNVIEMIFGKPRARLRDLHRKFFGKPASHICWEFIATK